MYKGKGERNGCNSYSVVEEIYAGILVDIVCRANEGLIDDEERGFRSGSGCVH